MSAWALVLASVTLPLVTTALEPADEPAPPADATSPEAAPEAAAPEPAPAQTPSSGIVRVPVEEEDPWKREPVDPNAPQPVPTQEAAARQIKPPELSEVTEGPKSPENKRAARKRRRKEKRGYERYESPQRFGVEIKFGPYLPKTDRNYTGNREFGPYALIFGQTDERGVTVDTPSKAFMFAVGFEWQFFNPGRTGPLGLGFTFSYMRDSAHAIFTKYAEIYKQSGKIPDTLPDGDTSIRSDADTVVFNTIPLALQLVYRFEFLADRYRVPLVPYGKAGLAYAFWWSNGNDGLSVNSRGESARGGTWGFQVNAGGMLRLDFLEGENHALDRQLGINHTYLFGEFQYSQIDNFGRADAVSLGDLTFFLGLAMEF